MAKKPKKKAPRRGAALKIVRGNGATRAPRQSRIATGGNDTQFPLIVDFTRGSSTPRLASLTALHRCGQWLAKRRAERVAVVGHANKRGSDIAAAALARARVAAVTKLLLLLGAAPAQVVPTPSPRLHPVWAGSTPGERRRRRIVVVFRYGPPRGEERDVSLPVPASGRAQRPARQRAAIG